MVKIWTLRHISVKKLLKKLNDAVKEWQNIAHSVGIRKKTIKLIYKEIEKNHYEKQQEINF